MPKNYTKDELENGRWVTMKGTRVFIKDGETPQDAIDRALGKSKKQEKKSYKDFDNIPDMTMELYKKTGINFHISNTNKLNKDTLAEVCDTLEDLQNKYHINEATDPNDFTKPRLEIKVPDDWEPEYKSDFTEDGENVFANARLNRITLNQKYYGLPKQKLNMIYGEGTQGYTPFHPRGTTAKDIIAHEAAHTMLNSKVWEMCKHDSDKYFKVLNFLQEHSEYDAMGESTLPEIKTLFNKFDRVQKKYTAYLKKDEEAVKYLGAELNRNHKVRYMANPKTFGFRYSISEYAAKNHHELVAESFADFYANGNEAKPLSRIVCFEILGIKEAKL